MNGSILRKASIKKLLLFLLILLLVCCGVFVLYLFEYITSTILLISFVLFFVFVSIVTGEITNRVVTKRMNKKLYNPKNYTIDSIDNIHNKLLENKATSKKYDFGTSYLLIKNNIAYKVVIVNDSNIYFNNERKKENTNNKLNNCNLFYGFEIFLNIDEDIIKKIQLYSFQTEKVYYTGFYCNDDINLIQANYEQPNNIHLENYNNLINLIGAVNNDSKQ